MILCVMEQKQKQTQKRQEEEIDDLPQRTETEADIDSILDEIDEVLEENAQAFVAEYIQKGGQ